MNWHRIFFESYTLLTACTFWTARLAMLCYAGGLWMSVIRPASLSITRWHRLFWTCGCFIFLVHVACAFQFLQGFHTAAWEHTARRTEELFGVRSGGGIYFNYLFAIGWLVDVLLLWLPAFDCLPRLAHSVWRGFMLFMVFNATIVFGSGETQIVSSAWLFIWLLWWGYQKKRVE